MHKNDSDRKKSREIDVSSRDILDRDDQSDDRTSSHTIENDT